MVRLAAVALLPHAVLETEPKRASPLLLGEVVAHVRDHRLAGLPCRDCREAAAVQAHRLRLSCFHGSRFHGSRCHGSRFHG